MPKTLFSACEEFIFVIFCIADELMIQWSAFIEIPNYSCLRKKKQKGSVIAVRN